MDELEYEQYRSVVESGQVSLDGLKRIIKHDYASGWQETSGGLARRKVAKEADEGTIIVKKQHDEKGDLLYENKWPLPLTFKSDESKINESLCSKCGKENIKRCKYYSNCQTLCSKCSEEELSKCH